LVPRQDGTGGKVKLGPISKRGNGYLRRLLVNGAMSVLNSKRAKQDPWLVKLLAKQGAQGGSRRLGQQDGAHRLGPDDAPGGLPGHFGGGLNGRRRQAREACEGEDA
jgi:hypothetical protein